MIERIEVLQAGASPLYGSDAIAGVVNVITVQQQRGLRASAQFGTFRQGDGHTQDYQASYGIQARPDQHRVRRQLCEAGSGLLARPLDLAIPQSGSDGLHDGGGRLQQRRRQRPLRHSDRRWLITAARRFSNPPDSTSDAGGSAGFTTADRFNFAPFKYILTPVDALRRLGQHQERAQRYGQPPHQGALQSPQFREQGGVRASVHRPRRRQRRGQPVRHPVDRRDQSVQSVRRDASIGLEPRRHVEWPDAELLVHRAAA